MREVFAIMLASSAVPHFKTNQGARWIAIALQKELPGGLRNTVHLQAHVKVNLNTKGINNVRKS